MAIADFFTKSFDLTFNHIYLAEEREVDINAFYSAEFKDVACVSRVYTNYSKKRNRDCKFIYLSSNLPFIILVRDPISRLKTMINHGGYKDEVAMNRNSFHLNDNIDEVLDRRRFHNNSLYPSLEQTMPWLIKHSKLVNFSYTSTAKICNKEVYYIDASEVNPDKVMDSMRKYAKFFGKDLDEERLKGLEGYLKEKKWGVLVHTIPLTLQVNSLQIKIVPKEQKENLKDYAKELIDKNLENLEVFNIIALAMSEEDFKVLKEDEKLFNETKTYLNEFVKKLENLRQKYVETYVKENDVLEYLKTYKYEALTLKKVLDKEFTHIKENRPDIVASWKYYGEFEKISERGS